MTKNRLTALMTMLYLLCISCSGNKNSGITNVYVCEGSYATKYHQDEDCKGLWNCKGEIVEITEEEAIVEDRKPCRICCKEIIKSAEEAIREVNEQPNLPEYVYIQNYCIHSYPKCPTLNYSGLKRLDVRTTDFTKDYYVFCGECVGDDLYKRLLKSPGVQIKKIYDILIVDYDMESEEEFRKNLANPKKRRRLYDTLVADGYELPTYEEFEANLGFGNN